MQLIIFFPFQVCMCCTDVINIVCWAGYCIAIEVKVAQSCPTLQPHGLYSPLNSLGQNTGVGSLSILQGSSQSRGGTQVSHIVGGFFTSRATREAQVYWSG